MAVSDLRRLLDIGAAAISDIEGGASAVVTSESGGFFWGEGSELRPANNGSANPNQPDPAPQRQDINQPHLALTLMKLPVQTSISNTMATPSDISKAKIATPLPPSPPSTLHLLQNPFRTLHTIWLFTHNDLKTIIFSSLSFSIFIHIATSPTPDAHWTTHLRPIPAIVLWTWLNLLPATIDNQRQPDSIQEDALNKPWRPLPSARISPSQATSIMYASIILSLLLSIYIGGLGPCLILLVLEAWYNRFSGADENYLIRNGLNGLGFLGYLAGAAEVALRESGGVDLWKQFLCQEGGALWMGILGLVVATTVQMQDLYDQVGDSARGRRTLPLVIGDGGARWVTAGTMVAWGAGCPVFWGWRGEGIGGWVSLGLTVVVVGRMLVFREVKDDRRTFLGWNFWLIGGGYVAFTWRSRRIPGKQESSIIYRQKEQQM
ncbi:hypothetical protein BO71DRAFT_455361 [Aspergillus ellipticus CBS 707.79]|uniref:UbiA prenyltransferase n=1 Tax=Aspergillus ellipticus CBS 707.79 TaxID=1448320 RepID=A0A319D7H0_9EURO|nr:hypothetical protein BO71DRAFT_455361 [Aspergillus ellipticus CBS 707.79]